jgi:hypothetical protein
MTKLLRKRYAALPPPLAEVWASGQAVDVSVLEKVGEYYILPHFDPGKVYIDAFWKAWITHFVQLGRGVGIKQEKGVVRLLPAGTVLAKP